MDVDFQEVRAEHGNTEVLLDYIDEGLSGDYNPDDPKDYPHVRFYISHKVEKSPMYEDDPISESYCTRIDARSDRAKLQAYAQRLAQAFDETGTDRWRKAAEKASWDTIDS